MGTAVGVETGAVVEAEPCATTSAAGFAAAEVLASADGAEAAEFPRSHPVFESMQTAAVTASRRFFNESDGQKFIELEFIGWEIFGKIAQIRAGHPCDGQSCECKRRPSRLGRNEKFTRADRWSRRPSQAVSGEPLPLPPALRCDERDSNRSEVRFSQSARVE